MASVLRIGLTYTRPIPGPTGPVVYQLLTGIHLGEEIASFLPLTENGAVTVPPHPPPGQPWTHELSVSPAGGDNITAKIGLNGQEVLSVTFPVSGSVHESKSFAFLDGEMTVTVGTAAAF